MNKKNLIFSEIMTFMTSEVYCCRKSKQRHSERKLIKFSKLKVLSIHFDSVPAQLLHRFDLSSCSDSLRRLCLLENGAYRAYRVWKNSINSPLIEKFIHSVKVLKNLESLTILMPYVCGSVINSIKHLQNLR